MYLFSPPKSILRIIALALVGPILSLLLTACATNHSLTKSDIGKEADLINPPRLINNPDDAKNLAWDKPSLFGPVPNNLLDAGEKICKPLGKDIIALGYNPKALDNNNQPIQGGGFLCARKEG